MAYAEFVVNINNIGVQKKPSVRKKKTKQIVDKTPEQIEKGFKMATAIGLQAGNIINRQVGSYTGNKVQQANVSQTLKYTGIMLGALINPIASISALTVDTAVNVIDYNIRVANAQQESDYKTSLVGQMASSGSRWRGGYR